MPDVLEGGGGDRAEITPRMRRLRHLVIGVALALLTWYALDAYGNLDTEARDTPGAVRAPDPPPAPGAPAPASALVASDGPKPRPGVVLALVGADDRPRHRTLDGTLLDLPSGVDPCQVPLDGAGGRGLVYRQWHAGTSRPALQPRDLAGPSRPVAPFRQLLGYRGEQAWTVDGGGALAPGSGVRTRYGVADKGRLVGSMTGDPGDAGPLGSPEPELPVALLDSKVTADPGDPIATGVVRADGADPTLFRAQGYDLRVEWPDEAGPVFHVDRVLGFGPDQVVTVDEPCPGGACGLKVVQVSPGGIVVHQGIALPDGWVVPESVGPTRIAFTADGGFVMGVRSHQGGSGLLYANPYSGRSVMVPGSAGIRLDGPRSVVADGTMVMFLVDPGEGADGSPARTQSPEGSRIAYWDSTTTAPARLLSERRVDAWGGLVCVVPRQTG